MGIADDYKDLIKILTGILESETDFQVSLQAADGIELLEKLDLDQPDVILMDIRMPKMNGITASEIIRERFPNIKIIAYSQYDIESNIIEMYVKGVKSFISKDDPQDELIKAIRIVYQGGVYMTNSSLEIIQKHLSSVRLPAIPSLNHFEKLLLHHICQGLSSVEIGALMNKSW